MVPIRLDLQNFLSYGTEAPTLDFEQFDVACLSGGNGEGKSALLDAMTWALWGEARKSSGKRKPDDELIRIGTQHMEVTFTFELADTRYRVTRSFSRSSTGKTSSSDLQFQVYDEGEDAYHPLTGSTQRETQARIEETLGLDYDTFINSAFLLQGRSDEFTNKSPSQRKDILVRILNLSRYEALEDRARDRWRRAKQRQQRLESDVERLEDALDDEDEWREERSARRAELEEIREALQTLRDREKALTQKRANLEAKARELESISSAVADLEERMEKKRDERATLEERIAEADALLEQSEAIRSAYERYQALQEERDALEEQRERHRTFEKELGEARRELREQTNELKRRLDRLKMERKGLADELEECNTALDDRSTVEAQVRGAQAARQELAEWEGRAARRKRLASRQEEARQALVDRREELRAQLDAVRDRLEEEREAVEALDDLEARIDRLERLRDRREALADRMATIESKGKSVAQTIQEHTGQLEARREERTREVAELRRFREAEGPTCPTCGTELTPAHREEVETTLQSSIAELKAEIEQREERLQSLQARRTSLREEYASLRSQHAELDGVGEALATAREQERSLTERADALEQHRETAGRLKQILEQGDYGADARRQWQGCAQQLAELREDSERVAPLRNRASHLDHLRRELEGLIEAAERRDDLAESIQDLDDEIDTIETALEEESAFEELRERIETLEAQLEDVSFDPERLQALRAELAELSDAPDRRSDLRHARENREEWTGRIEAIDDELEALQDERDQKRARKDELTEALDDRSALEEEIEDVSSEIEAREQEVNDAQQALGKLDERLDQAERDRAALESTREELEECTSNRHLYKHLRSAFGKHGMPSLIIEETVPEIERRANDILGRLSDGRMHVRLETLTEKKSGGTKETLDIIITDEQGVARPYETYSGGESFRVNFALRVALAQILAERSGVRVRTLVIDEGFGTQDEDGIERLVEAIQQIRTDFAKILVITHLPRLKEAFPIRIEVEKDPVVGSTFEVVGA